MRKREPWGSRFLRSVAILRGLGYTDADIKRYKRKLEKPRQTGGIPVFYGGVPMTYLRMHHVTKRFGKLTAVKDVSLEILPGTIHAVVGENGAGKSTLMKCLYGMHPPERGSFYLGDRQLVIRSPRDAMKYGIGMVHQHFMLVPSATVAQNVVLGDEPRKGSRFDGKRASREVLKLSRTFGLEVEPDMPVYALPVGLQQRVEILKLLYRKASILIFDEPTAVLSPGEVESLFGIIRGFRKEGKTVIFIAHNLEEVLALSDTISVMRQGELVDTVPRNAVSSGDLARMMVGREIALPVLEDVSRTKGKTLLSLKNLWVRNDRGGWAVRDLSLDLSEGEIFGVAGVTGNGQSELEEALWGLRPVEKGSLLLEEQPLDSPKPRERREKGMAYIPEDRLKTGLAPLGDLEDNLLMGYQYQPRFCRKGFLKNASKRRFAGEVLERYGVAAASPRIQGGTLSGGNMQRLVMGRELEHDPKVLLVSQPTRGVDIGGISAIHDHLLRLRSQGRSILLISSSLEEILALSDRVAVMVKGRFVSVLSREDVSKEKIGALMLQGGAEEEMKEKGGEPHEPLR